MDLILQEPCPSGCASKSKSSSAQKPRAPNGEHVNEGGPGSLKRTALEAGILNPAYLHPTLKALRLKPCALNFTIRSKNLTPSPEP